MPCGLSLYGAIGSLLFFNIEAYGLFGLADGALDEAGASGELSIALGRLARGELRLPLALSFSSDPSIGFEARAGIEWELD
jgi:hypothetical protein